MNSAKSQHKNRNVALIPETIGVTGPIYAFFADRGVRETVESIVVAVLLALLFRGFEGEAFMIPTGSMAPGLRGHHIDLVCEKCGFENQTTASYENNLTPADKKEPVTRTYCPICGYCTTLNPARSADHRANQGDRILVNKYIYDFQEPRRFDVVVFKNPNNGKQNLIKRLAGLPGEHISIRRGDLYTSNPDGSDSRIVRKPPYKQLAMLQIVDDTGHRAKELRDAGWPENWAAWKNDFWKTDEQAGQSVFSVDAPDDAPAAWLRFRNIRPISTPVNLNNQGAAPRAAVEWEDYVDDLKLPPRIENFRGRLIADHYGYNEHDRQISSLQSYYFPSLGNHWVGDLAVELTMTAEQASGSVLLDLVEGGVHFTCTIDLATGTGSFDCDSAEVVFGNDQGQDGQAPAGFPVPVGIGRATTILFCNVDNRLLLWVNGKLLETAGSSYKRPEQFYPTYTPDDPGDAQPVGIGVRGTELSVSRLKVLRDVYYVSRRGLETDTRNETGLGHEFIERVHQSPESWESEESKMVFDASIQNRLPMFSIPAGNYFTLGDNSPESKDARVWEGPNYFPRDLLIGRAMLVYWPHSLNRPVPFTPNFGQMRPIR